MGSDYHITRASDWTANEGREITGLEWQKYALNDPELSSDPENGPNSFIWSAHPEGMSEAWLDWSKGNVYSTDPDPALLKKMQRIAARLDARVLNDDNEVCAPVEDRVE